MLTSVSRLQLVPYILNMLTHFERFWTKSDFFLLYCTHFKFRRQPQWVWCNRRKSLTELLCFGRWQSSGEQKGFGVCFCFFTVFSSARGGSSSSMVHVIQILFIWYVTVVKQRDGEVADTALKNGCDSLWGTQKRRKMSRLTHRSLLLLQPSLQTLLRCLQCLF